MAQPRVEPNDDRDAVAVARFDAQGDLRDVRGSKHFSTTWAFQVVLLHIHI